MSQLRFWQMTALILLGFLAGSWLDGLIESGAPGPLAGGEAEASQRSRGGGDTDRLLGPGDIRFGVAIEPGSAAVLANWRNQQAVFINADGRHRTLNFKLKHQHAAVRVPEQGITVIESIRGRYYRISADGQVRRIPGIE
jgi:hypothetical protein